MINLSSEICIKLRDARRKAGISQTELSKEVGCKQSALSMFEQGDGTKLNDEVVDRIAKKFGIEISPVSATEVRAYSPSTEEGAGFCPNPHCPSNRTYQVDGRELHLPDRKLADPIGGKYCAMCGEVLEKRCPSCGAKVHDGAICSICGNTYIVG